MATRAIKGLLVRNDWQFFESACAWASIQVNLPNPLGGVALVNNAKFGESLDVYRAEIDITQGAPTEWKFSGPTNAFTATGGPSIIVTSTNLLLPQPVGQLVAFSSFTGGLSGTVHNRGSNVFFDSIELANGGPFVTLPAGWGLVCLVPSGAGVSVTAAFWYQVMQDQIVPAQ